MVAKALALQLREAGYRVTTFADGETGLAALLAAGDVDLVFCDLMMTGMTGIELAERLAAAAPEMASKLVLMTGGAFSPAARDVRGAAPRTHRRETVRHRRRGAAAPRRRVTKAGRGRRPKAAG